jgi:hypothetical protein
MTRTTLAVFAICTTSIATAAEWPAPETYLSLSCNGGPAQSQALCNSQRKEWIDDYRLAIKGDYQGQRNVAFCLGDGCDGAVTRNTVLSCAWRLVIVRSGHLDLGWSDFQNLKDKCTPEKLGIEEHAAAEAQSRRIADMIANHVRVSPSP